MNYLRELLYRPRKHDGTLMSKFYYADETLNKVAAELDSFDGRKDPERCTQLVNKLRSCQDKLLVVCGKMLEEIEPGLANRSREFRAKFPDDIMTDTLAGQLWFGAECLAAGSSILNKERESDEMRPLAKAVTKHLEKVRHLLREQCLTPQPEYTEAIRENIKIFDRLFADFEFAYVQCMVHVKTVREYELHQDLTVLFSDTLQRAVRHGMITQDMVDTYEPSLMFAIPRLAIVYGLLISPTGPLNVERSSADFPDLFLPFKNLLKKIKELLLTLAPHEVEVLEMILCQHEEPANIGSKLKEVEHRMANKEKSQGEQEQANKLTEKLVTLVLNPEVESSLAAAAAASADPSEPAAASMSREERRRKRHREKKEAREVVKGILDEVLQGVVSANNSESSPANPADYEIDCTDPDIRVTPRRRVFVTTESAASSNSSPGFVEDPTTTTSAASEQRPGSSSAGPSSAYSAKAAGDDANASGAAMASYSPRPRQRLKRHNAKRDSRRIPLRYQKDRRAKFKSIEDLLQRLYVCISGAADQLQSNYAGDFRAILRTVFNINVTQDEADSPEHEEEEDDEEEDESNGTSAVQSPTSPTATGAVAGAAAPERRFPVDVGTDALVQEGSDELGNNLPRSSEEEEDEQQQTQHGARQHQPERIGVYAQNLDLHLPQSDEYTGREERDFYQSEPTLLDIASGTDDNLPAESVGEESLLVDPLGPITLEAPPQWVPDEAAPNCMGCGVQFTIIRRRHHCRSCGLVFCNSCSRHSLALPRFGIDRPVRVCNRCHVILGHQAGNNAQSPRGVQETREADGGGGDMARSPWSRNFGMVS